MDAAVGAVERVSRRALARVGFGYGPEVIRTPSKGAWNVEGDAAQAGEAETVDTSAAGGTPVPEGAQSGDTPGDGDTGAQGGGDANPGGEPEATDENAGEGNVAEAEADPDDEFEVGDAEKAIDEEEDPGDPRGVTGAVPPRADNPE